MPAELPDAPRSSVDAARKIDECCDQFEEAWQAGRRPNIEDFLSRVPADMHRQLTEELLLLEVFYRHSQGELPRVDEYVSRFGGLPRLTLDDIVRRGLQAPHQRGSTPGDSPTIAAGAALGEGGDRVRYFGDYELLERIASGGMGVVYKARQVSLNRLVAVKMILSGQFASEAEVKRFYSEAESAAQLDHPRIVSIYEVGEHAGLHFFSMALVEGVSLSARLNAGPLEPLAAAEILREVALAVQYAHEHGVIHRDLKPSNILLDAAGRPRITDFGLAKRVSSAQGLTITGDVLGTPSYMPPEQAAGKIDAVSPASDVYALGAVLYALLSGRPPFQAASSVDTLRQVVDQEPVRLRQLNAAIPRDLETIAHQCLEKSVSRRYASAAALADELQRYLEQRPILARPISRVERGWRWCRRNPVVAALGSAAFVLLASVATIATTAYLREARLSGELARRTTQLERKTEELTRALARETGLVISERAAKVQAQTAENKEREQRLEAQRQTRLAELNRLAMLAQTQIKEFPERGILLATEAATLALVHEEPVPLSVKQMLRTALAYAGDNRVGGARGNLPGQLLSADISPDGRWLAAAMFVAPLGGRAAQEPADELVYVFDLHRGGEDAPPLVLRRPDRMRRREGGGVAPPPELLREASGELRFSHDGRWLIFSDERAHLVWDTRAADMAESMQSIPSLSIVRLGMGLGEGPAAWRSASGRWALSKILKANGKSDLHWHDFTSADPGKRAATMVSDVSHQVAADGLFSPRERYWASTPDDDAHASALLLYEFDAAEQAQRLRYLSGAERTMHKPLRFSPNEQWLVATQTTSDEWAWDLAHGAKTAADVPKDVQPVTKSDILLWRTATAPQPFLQLTAGDEPYFRAPLVEFSANGRWLYLVRYETPKGTRMVETTEPTYRRRFVRADGRPVTNADLVSELLRYDLASDDVAASKHVVGRVPQACRCLLTAADGRWIALGCEDARVRVWLAEQPELDEPWQTLAGHEAAVTHLYSTPHTERFVSRSSFSSAAETRGGRPNRLRDLGILGQCVVWSLESDGDQELIKFSCCHRYLSPEPAKSLDGRWWITSDGTIDVLSADASGAGIVQHALSDVADPAFGGQASTKKGLQNVQAPVLKSAAIVNDQWVLAHRSASPTALGGLPIYLYPLGSGPRSLEPRVLDVAGAGKGFTQSVEFSPDGRWMSRLTEDPQLATRQLQLFRYDQPRSAPVVIEKLHDNVPTNLLFSPGGRFLAYRIVEGPYERLSIWRLSDTKQPQLIVREESLRVLRAASLAVLAFSRDERWFAMAQGERSARLFDLQADDVTSAQQRLSVEPESSDSASHTALSLDFSPDGRWLAGRLAQHTKTVFWDLTSKDIPGSVRSFSGHVTASYAFFVDEGRRLITAERAGYMYEWDCSALPDKLTKVPPAYEANFPKGRSAFVTGEGLGQRLSHDRRFVAFSGGLDVAIWDLSRDRIAPSIRLAQEKVQHVVFCPDGKSAFTVSGDMVRMWDLTSADVPASGIVLPTPEHLNMLPITGLAVSPDNRFLIATGAQQSLVWTLPFEEIYGLARSVAGRELTIDERKLFVVPPRVEQLPPAAPVPSVNSVLSRQMILPVKDAAPPPVRSADEVVRFVEHRTPIGRLAVSPDGKYVASTSGPIQNRILTSPSGSEWSDYLRSEPQDRRVLVWETKTGRMVREFSNAHRVVGLAWSSDKHIAWTTRGREVFQAKVASGLIDEWPGIPATEIALDLLPSANVITRRVAASPMSDRSSANVLTVRKLESGNLVAALSDNGWRQLSGATAWTSPERLNCRDSRLLFVPSGEIWDWKTNERISLWNQPRINALSVGLQPAKVLQGAPLGASFSADGAQAVVVTATGAYRFQLAQQTIEELPLLRRDEETALAHSADGQWLASLASDGKTIALYSIADRKVVKEFAGHTSEITSLIFTPDNGLLISAGTDSSIRVWRIRKPEQ